MNIRTLLTIVTFGFLTAAPAWAGPPVICHVAQIGSAQSLPWRTDATGWNGIDPSYNISHVVADTLRLLTPDVSTDVRMETLRRAAIYSARHDAPARELLSRLTSRARESEAAGRAEPAAWFDAAYFAEGLRELRRDYGLPQLTPEFDELGWLQKAIRLGGRHMEQAVALVELARVRERY